MNARDFGGRQHFEPPVGVSDPCTADRRQAGRDHRPLEPTHPTHPVGGPRRAGRTPASGIAARRAAQYDHWWLNHEPDAAACPGPVVVPLSQATCLGASPASGNRNGASGGLMLITHRHPVPGPVADDPRICAPAHARNHWGEGDEPRDTPGCSRRWAEAPTAPLGTRRGVRDQISSGRPWLSPARREQWGQRPVRLKL
jgi:hypothetical protein